MSYELYSGRPWTSDDHVSEREPDGSWEDCLPSSLVMLARAAGLDVPSTRQEAEALRAAAGYGPTGGTSLEGLRPAFVKRYGISFTIAKGPKAASILIPGRAAAVVGSMGAFPPTHRLRRWDRGFGGVHGVFGALGAADSEFLWDNPLAPEGIGYDGELVSAAELQAYYQATSSREIGWLESGSATSGGGNQPVSVGFTLTKPGAIGSLVMKGDGHWYLTIADGVVHGPVTAAALGTKSPAYPIRLDAPISPGPGNRQDGYLIGDEAAFVLAQDVIFTPSTPPAADCSAAVQMRDLQWVTHLTPPK